MSPAQWWSGGLTRWWPGGAHCAGAQPVRGTRHRWHGHRGACRWIDRLAGLSRIGIDGAAYAGRRQSHDGCAWDAAIRGRIRIRSAVRCSRVRLIWVWPATRTRAMARLRTEPWRGGGAEVGVLVVLGVDDVTHPVDLVPHAQCFRTNRPTAVAVAVARLVTRTRSLC